jgi:hypothetical protein
MTATTSEAKIRGESWRRQDLSAFLADGYRPPAPTMLRRTDDHCLIYPGAIHWFFGEPESLKSFVLLIACAQVLDDDGIVVYIDLEDSGAAVAHRLRMLGIDPEVIRARFRYVSPTEPSSVGFEWLEAFELPDAELVVIDACTEAMSVDGLVGTDNADVADWVNGLVRPIAETGIAVAVLDHVTKTIEGRGKWPIGAQHKMAAVSGAAYSVVCVDPLAPTSDPNGRTGRSRIKLVKDRPGEVRRLHPGALPVVAVAEITAWPDGGLTYRLTLPDTTDSAEIDRHVLDRVLEVIATDPGINKRGIRDSVSANHDVIDRVITYGLQASPPVIRWRKEGAAHAHYLPDDFPGENAGPFGEALL